MKTVISKVSLLSCAITLIGFFHHSELNAQIRTTVLPDAGFEERIEKVVNDIRLIDTHEHLRMEEKVMQDSLFDFTHLFQQYIKDDLKSAGMSAAVFKMVSGKMFSITDRWEMFKPFWYSTRVTGYGRVPLIIANDLYGIPDINDDTYLELSKRINDSMKPGWYKHVLKDMAGIDLSIVDAGHVQLDKDFYVHVERFDDFIHVFSASEINGLGQKHGIEIESLDDYLLALEKAFQAGLEYEMVGVKSGLAYSRIIKYDNVPKERAEEVFQKILSRDGSQARLDFESVKPLQDYMMHRVLDLTDKHDLPFQVHTGLHAGNGNVITNSKPTHLNNLFHEYPDVEFCIFHSSYPYGGELSVLAKNFPNVFIDMCWTQVISPYFSERYLHEWLETVPANKIMAFGGDYRNVESVYAHSVMARRVVAKVLIEKVANAYMTEEEAIDIAKRILRENAMEIFKLGGKSRDGVGLPALSEPGPMQDLWEMVKQEAGFIKNWMVIGPFDTEATVHSQTVAPPGFDKEYPPEKEIEFSKTYSGMNGDVIWKEATTRQSGMLDFNAIYYPNNGAIAYAYAEIESPDDRKAMITLGSDDGAKVWINKELVYSKHIWRAAVPDDDFIDIQLKKGNNTILVKVENRGAGWEMIVRLVDPEGALRLGK